MLLPETIEDYVAPENPVRFLDAFVASLDLHALGFAKAIAAYTGRPPYEPGRSLRLYLYGYLHRLRSSRQLEKECHRNLELIWLIAQARARSQNHRRLPQATTAPASKLVHRQFHLLCHKLKLFGGELVAIDGSKLAAVNARASAISTRRSCRNFWRGPTRAWPSICSNWTQATRPKRRRTS